MPRELQHHSHHPQQQPQGPTLQRSYRHPRTKTNDQLPFWVRRTIPTNFLILLSVISSAWPYRDHLLWPFLLFTVNRSRYPALSIHLSPRTDFSLRPPKKALHAEISGNNLFYFEFSFYKQQRLPQKYFTLTIYRPILSGYEWTVDE